MAPTLLLADDSPTMQRVVELTFAEQGMNVVSVSDGQEALDYLSAGRPALALLSVTLHKLDGFEVARIVRDSPALRGVPVLLLAGAFDTIDEVRVRESGAAGILVKPLEPGLVIKRVKELLGMSKPDAPATSGEPAASAPGRLVTSGDLTVHEPVQQAETRAPGPNGEPRPKTAGTWQELRETTGLTPDTAAVETAETDDYFGKLDAAFDSLDAQLAGRSAPASRATNASPPPGVPAATDPDRRSTAPPSGGPAEREDAAQQVQAQKPVFEVDDDWFGQNAASSVKREELAPGAQGAPGAANAPRAQDVLRSSPPSREAPRVEEFVPDLASAFAHAVPDRSQPFDPTDPPGALSTSSAPGLPAADAFALLWAHEQGEPLPPTPPAPPIELSGPSVVAVVEQVTNRLAPRITEDLVARMTDGVVARIGSELNARLSTESSTLTTALGDRLIGEVRDRIPSGLADQLSSELSTRITTALAAQVSQGLSEQIAAHVAERMMQSAFGDSLRQTVHDVSERLVREEIARIRAAASDSRRS